MATKKKQKKTKSKSSRSQKTNKRLAKKSVTAKKSVAAKKAARNKTRVTSVRSRGRNEDVGTVAYEPKGLGAGSAGQSGDLQGLSHREGADTESVDELLEEGNAFEAEVVKGVEDAPDPDEGEIRTREVPEEDVPEEYLEGDDEGPSRRGRTTP